MDYKYLSALVVSSCFILTGCELTDDDKKKLDQAGNNLEKIALKPLITSPTNDDIIRDNTTIRVDTDPTVVHSSVTLKIKGEEITTDTEFPFEFNWQPYFWSTEGESQVTLQVTAITEGDSYLRSDLVNVTLDSELKNTLSIISPSANQSLINVDTTQLQWSAMANATSYEYQLNEQSIVTTADNDVTLELTETGVYSVKIRATNEEGRTGAWTSLSNFTLDKPNTPTLRIPVITKAASGWNVDIAWANGLTSTEVEIATDTNFISILDNTSTEATSINKVLPTGKYYVRVRTTNEFGHSSEWGQTKEVVAGLFAHKIDMATNGMNTSDYPVDFIINPSDAVVLARYSNMSDGSGDDFYVSKIDYKGTTTWGRSLKNYASSPTSINKSSSGYILSGSSSSNYRNRTILEINELGNKLWQHNIQHTHDTDESTITYERVTDVVELAENKFAILHSSSLSNITGVNDWGYTTEFVENILSIDLLDRSSGNSNVTKNTITNPSSGEYVNLNKLLHTDSGLYAAGRYKANNAQGNDNSADDFTPVASTSGSFLLTLDNTDGTVTSERVGGGLADANVTSLIELENGEILTSYDNYYTGAITNFPANANTSSSKIDGAIKYSKIAPLPNGDYVTVGESRSNDRQSIITRYTSENIQVGSRHTFNNCFYDLGVTSIKYHPDYGLIILGTDGYNYSSKYTVIFNITENFEYLCPTVKE